MTTSKTTTRRSVLAGATALATGLAAGPAVAGAAQGTAAGPIGPDPDAELIALGEQMKPLLARYLELGKVSHRLHVECFKLAGPMPKAGKKWRAWHRRWDRMSERNGYLTAADAWNAAGAPVREVAAKVLAFEPRTVAGMRVLAAAVLVDTSGYAMENGGPIEDFVWRLAEAAGFPPMPDPADDDQDEAVAS